MNDIKEYTVGLAVGMVAIYITYSLLGGFLVSLVSSVGEALR